MLWLAATALCTLAWLKRLDVLPDSSGSIMPLKGASLEVVAWVSAGLSFLVLLYKCIRTSPAGIKLLDTVAAWFKAVYISYLMLISSLLYIPITKVRATLRVRVRVRVRLTPTLTLTQP